MSQMLSDAQVRIIARDGFYQSNPALSDWLFAQDSYVENGTTYPANGQTFARAIELVRALSDEQLVELDDQGIITLPGCSVCHHSERCGTCAGTDPNCEECHGSGGCQNCSPNGPSFDR